MWWMILILLIPPSPSKPIHFNRRHTGTESLHPFCPSALGCFKVLPYLLPRLSTARNIRYRVLLICPASIQYSRLSPYVASHKAHLAFSRSRISRVLDILYYLFLASLSIFFLWPRNCEEHSIWCWRTWFRCIDVGTAHKQGPRRKEILL